MTTVQTEVAVGILNVAALPGIFASQAVSDAMGRTSTLAFASSLFCIGAFTMAAAQSFAVLVAGRICVGIGLGFGLSIDPLTSRKLLQHTAEDFSSHGLNLL